MCEKEPGMNYIERTWLPWQWISHDIELLELKVGRDRATVDVERRAKPGKESPSRDNWGRTKVPSD